MGSVFSLPATDFEKTSQVVIVKDDFFKADLANLIEQGIQTYRWRYHHKSDANDPANNKFFLSHLWSHSCEENLFHTLWKLIHKEIQIVHDYDCWRIIANGQVKGQNGNWHTDHGDKTVLYYPTEWQSDWGGSTYFTIDNATKEVHYKKNRLIVFDSTISHYGSCPTVENILRVSIAFNLRRRATELSQRH